MKPFLKWAGGKTRICPKINTYLPKSSPTKNYNRLVEPFVGSGAVFLNTDYTEYLLTDINPDLINLYKILQTEGESFIDKVRELFTPETNTPTFYSRSRSGFNSSTDLEERACLFIYLNRHCYNGLCRYNKKGQFNTPFGSYTRPYFPEEELHFFYQTSKKATFEVADYRHILGNLKNGDVVYCDPPYIPLSDTSNFTTYFGVEFTLRDHRELVKLLLHLNSIGVPSLISNHSTPETKKLYEGFIVEEFPVRRSISASNRDVVMELLALY